MITEKDSLLLLRLNIIYKIALAKVFYRIKANIKIITPKNIDPINAYNPYSCK